MMKLAYTLPPDFDVEQLLDDLFPERLVKRFRAAEALDLRASEFSDAVCETCLGFIRRNGTCDCPAVRRAQ